MNGTSFFRTHEVDADDVFDEALYGMMPADEVVIGSTNTTRIDKTIIVRWLKRARRSGVLPQVAEWRAEDAALRYRGGREPLLSDEVIFTICLILMAEHSKLQTKVMGQAFLRLTPAAREALGIEHLFNGERRDWKVLANRAVRRFIDTFDGWKSQRKCSIFREEREERAAQQRDNAARIDMMRSRGEWFTNKLIAMTLEELPADLRQDRVALTVDQTAFDAGTEQFPWKRNRKSKKEEYQRYQDNDEEVQRPVFEPEAGPYPKKKGASVKDPVKLKGAWIQGQWVMAFMGNVVLGVFENPYLDNSPHGPQLIMAASLGSPNKRIGEDTLALIDIIRARGTHITRLSFDKGYSLLSDKKFHKPLRERNIPVVKDYSKKQSGITNGYGGAHFVDGDWYCASTPKDLLEATVRFNKKHITEEEWHRDVDQRQAYKLHVKEVMPNGKAVKYQCPAIGASATVTCPLREMHEKAEAKEDLEQVFDSHIVDPNVTVCCQKSINIPVEENGKLGGQKYSYGTQTHNKVYKADRASSESANKTLHNHVAPYSKPANRPMRGLAAAQFAWALLVVSFNYARIAEYMHERYKSQQSKTTERLPRQSTPKPPSKPVERRKTIRRRDREGWSHYKRNYVARATYVVTRP